jgi:hypothetical protein
MDVAVGTVELICNERTLDILRQMLIKKFDMQKHIARTYPITACSSRGIGADTTLSIEISLVAVPTCKTDDVSGLG